jgi:hypothetical protein
MKAYRAIRDPQIIDGHQTRWTIQRRGFFGWRFEALFYGDEKAAQKFLGDLAYPQIITVYVNAESEFDEQR